MEWKVYDYLDIGVIVVDKQQEICYVNPWILLRLGRRQIDVLSTPLIETFPLFLNKRIQMAIQASIKFNSSQYFQHEDIPHVIEMEATPPLNRHLEKMYQDTRISSAELNGEQHILICITDVSEMKLLRNQVPQ